MSTLIILIGSFVILWLLNQYVLVSRLSLSFIGRVALAIMLLFTGSAHFYKEQEMVAMMPADLPYKLQLVYITGILEIAGAIGLVSKRLAIAASIGLILFFLAMLPANIIGAQKRVALGGMESGPAYLYFRIPLQLLFIGWTYYFGIYRLRKPPEHVVIAHNKN